MRASFLLFWILEIPIAVISTVTEVVFKDCDTLGWLCSNDMDISFHCNLVPESIKFNVSLMNLQLPDEASSFAISDCEDLTIDFHTPYPSTLKRLSVARIHRLSLLPSDLIFHPPDILFEDITFIDEIPRRAFSYPKTEDIIFRRVIVDLVEDQSFVDIDQIFAFVWEEVSVKTISKGAVKISLQKEGIFRLFDSLIDESAPSSVSVNGGTSIIDRCVFNRIQTATFHLSSPTFFFIGNKINDRINRCGFNVSSSEVYFENNWINNADADALKCISPIENDCVNGTFQFFVRLNHFESAGLRSLESSSTNKECYLHIGIVNNTFACKLHELQWIRELALKGSNTPDLKNYYQMVLSIKSNNTCIEDCRLPIATAFQISSESGEKDVRRLCRLYEEAVYEPKRTTKNNGFRLTSKISCIVIIISIFSIFK